MNRSKIATWKGVLLGLSVCLLSLTARAGSPFSPGQLVVQTRATEGHPIETVFQYVGEGADGGAVLRFRDQCAFKFQRDLRVLTPVEQASVETKFKQELREPTRQAKGLMEVALNLKDLQDMVAKAKAKPPIVVIRPFQDWPTRGGAYRDPWGKVVPQNAEESVFPKVPGVIRLHNRALDTRIENLVCYYDSAIAEGKVTEAVADSRFFSELASLRQADQMAKIQQALEELNRQRK